MMALIFVSETAHKLSEKTPNNQVARQDPRYRSPEEDRNAKHTYSSEVDTAKTPELPDE